MLIASSTLTETQTIDRYKAFRGVRHFGSLDGLRALSVIAVIWHHTVGHDPRLPDFFARGAHGVTLFFAISGFLIVTLLLREAETRGGIDLRKFYMRRALRIFPLYYAVLLIYVVLVVVVEKNSSTGREFLKNLPFFLTYTSNLFVVLDGRVIFYFAWSLAAEEQFYLLWPSVQRFFTRWRAFAIMMGFILIVLALQYWVQAGGSYGSSWWGRAIVNFPLAICFGVVMAYVLHYPTTFRLSQSVLAGQFSSMAFGCALIASLAIGTSSFFIHLAAALFVGACAAREDHLLAPLLKWRVLAFVGTVSYGIYLLHMLVKNVVSRLLSLIGMADAKMLVFAGTLVATIGVAFLSFRYFEGAFLRAKQRFTVNP